MLKMRHLCLAGLLATMAQLTPTAALSWTDLKPEEVRDIMVGRTAYVFDVFDGGMYRKYDETNNPRRGTYTSWTKTERGRGRWQIRNGQWCISWKRNPWQCYLVQFDSKKNQFRSIFDDNRIFVFVLVEPDS